MKKKLLRFFLPEHVYSRMSYQTIQRITVKRFEPPHALFTYEKYRDGSNLFVVPKLSQQELSALKNELIPDKTISLRFHPLTKLVSKVTHLKLFDEIEEKEEEEEWIPSPNLANLSLKVYTTPGSSSIVFPISLTCLEGTHDTRFQFNYVPCTAFLGWRHTDSFAPPSWITPSPLPFHACRRGQDVGHSADGYKREQGK